MSAPHLDLEAIREIARRTRAEQGLPPTIEDPIALARVWYLIRLPHEEPLSNAS